MIFLATERPNIDGACRHRSPPAADHACRQIRRRIGSQARMVASAATRLLTSRHTRREVNAPAATVAWFRQSAPGNAPGKRNCVSISACQTGGESRGVQCAAGPWGRPGRSRTRSGRGGGGDVTGSANSCPVSAKKLSPERSVHRAKPTGSDRIAIVVSRSDSPSSPTARPVIPDCRE